MNTDRIQSILKELEAETASSTGMIRHEVSYKPHATIVQGNRAGLLKFGTECIRHALNEDSKEYLEFKDFRNERLNELNGSLYDSFAFQRWDGVKKEVEPPKSEETESSKTSVALKLFLYSFTTAILLIGAVGTYTTATWIISKF